MFAEQIRWFTKMLTERRVYGEVCGGRVLDSHVPRIPGDYAAWLRSVAATSRVDRTGTSTFASLQTPSQLIWPSTTISCIFHTGSHTPSSIFERSVTVIS
jgi:hypothetical protein